VPTTPSPNARRPFLPSVGVAGRTPAGSGKQGQADIGAIGAPIAQANTSVPPNTSGPPNGFDPNTLDFWIKDWLSDTDLYRQSYGTGNTRTPGTGQFHGISYNAVTPIGFIAATMAEIERQIGINVPVDLLGLNPFDSGGIQNAMINFVLPYLRPDGSNIEEALRAANYDIQQLADAWVASEQAAGRSGDRRPGAIATLPGAEGGDVDLELQGVLDTLSGLGIDLNAASGTGDVSQGASPFVIDPSLRAVS